MTSPTQTTWVSLMLVSRAARFEALSSTGWRPWQIDAWSNRFVALLPTPWHGPKSSVALLHYGISGRQPLAVGPSCRPPVPRSHHHHPDRGSHPAGAIAPSMRHRRQALLRWTHEREGRYPDLHRFDAVQCDASPSRRWGIDADAARAYRAGAVWLKHKGRRAAPFPTKLDGGILTQALLWSIDHLVDSIGKPMRGNSPYVLWIIVLAIALLISILVAHANAQRANRENANRIKAFEESRRKDVEVVE